MTSKCCRNRGRPHGETKYQDLWSGPNRSLSIKCMCLWPDRVPERSVSHLTTCASKLVGEVTQLATVTGTAPQWYQACLGFLLYLAENTATSMYCYEKFHKEIWKSALIKGRCRRSSPRRALSLSESFSSTSRKCFWATTKPTTQLISLRSTGFQWEDDFYWKQVLKSRRLFPDSMQTCWPCRLRTGVVSWLAAVCSYPLPTVLTSSRYR